MSSPSSPTPTPTPPPSEDFVPQVSAPPYRPKTASMKQLRAHLRSHQQTICGLQQENHYLRQQVSMLQHNRYLISVLAGNTPY